MPVLLQCGCKCSLQSISLSQAYLRSHGYSQLQCVLTTHANYTGEFYCNMFAYLHFTVGALLSKWVQTSLSQNCSYVRFIIFIFLYQNQGCILPGAAKMQTVGQEKNHLLRGQFFFSSFFKIDITQCYQHNLKKKGFCIFTFIFSAALKL